MKNKENAFGKTCPNQSYKEIKKLNNLVLPFDNTVIKKSIRIEKIKSNQKQSFSYL